MVAVGAKSGALLQRRAAWQPCNVEVHTVWRNHCSAYLQQLGCKPAQVVLACLHAAQSAYVHVHTIFEQSGPPGSGSAHKCSLCLFLCAASVQSRRQVGHCTPTIMQSAPANVQLFRSIAASCDATDRGAV